MNHLSQDEIVDILNKIKSGQSLPEHYKEKLFQSNDQPTLYWKGKECHPLSFTNCHNIQYFPGETTDTQWRNQIIHGSIQSVLGALHNGYLKEKIQKLGGIKLIYIDPPFDVGTQFKMTRPIGDSQHNTRLETVAYRDSWSNHSTELLNILYSTLNHLYDLLADDGSIYVHCDWRLSGSLRLMLDEIFGPTGHRNEICWRYNSRTMSSQWFARKHDTIFLYSKSTHPIFNGDAVRIPHKPESRIQYNKKDEDGRLYKQQSNGKRSYLNHLGQPCPDVWDIQLLGSRTPERVGYPTQKPRMLLERIIAASSNEGDIVADFFCGSGVLAEAATNLNRRWICADIGPLAIQTTSKRLLKPIPPLRRPCFERLQCIPEPQPFTMSVLFSHYGADTKSENNISEKSGRTVIAITETNIVTDFVLQEYINRIDTDKGIDILAHQYSESCLRWIKNNHKAFDITPKIIPMQMLRSQASGAVFFMNALLPSTTIKSTQNQKTINLNGLWLFSSKHDRNNDNERMYIMNSHLFKVSSRASAPKQITQHWSDWVEGWSIAYRAPNTTTTTVLWHAFRYAPSRELPLTTDPLSIPDEAQIEISVSDIFGHTHSSFLPKAMQPC